LPYKTFSHLVPRSTTNAVEKTCRILCALTDPGIRRLVDIAGCTGIDKATALRILGILQQEGLVERDTAKHYRFGAEAYAMAAALREPRNLQVAARPALAELARTTGDTVLLLVRRGDESICVDREVGTFPIQASTVTVGTRLPLGGGAGSLALITWLDTVEADAILKRVRPRLERYPGLKLAAIRNEMLLARERGYAIFYDIFIKGIGAMAAPIRDMDGRPVAAVSTSSVSARIAERQDWIALNLVKAAQAIEAAVNGHPPASTRKTQPQKGTHEATRRRS